MADHTQKCANAPCSCPAAPDSNYCSAACEGASDKTELVCHCGHSGCKGDVTEV